MLFQAGEFGIRIPPRILWSIGGPPQAKCSRQLPLTRAQNPWNLLFPAAIHLPCHASKTHVGSTTDPEFTHTFC